MDRSLRHGKSRVSKIGLLLVVFLIALISICANAQRVARPSTKAEPAASQTYSETIVHQFAHFGGDGSFPLSIVSDGSGNLYGVTNEGGSAGQGALFSLTLNGTEPPNYSLLASLTGGPTFVTIDNQGNLYIVWNDAQGGVFEVSKEANGSLVVSNTYSFTGGFDGVAPTMVLPDSQGNLYGSTGLFFELQAADDQWLFEPLYPVSAGAILMDKKGDFYGTSSSGGAGVNGNVLKLSKGKNGWVEKVIRYFQGGADDGTLPVGTLSFGPDSKIYGVTQKGLLGFGGVYSITKSGTLTWLYVFTGGADGSYPSTGVTFDNLGNLYGVTSAGGSFSGQYCGSLGCGVAYKLTRPAGNQDAPWTENVLYTFSGGTDGYGPVGPPVVDDAGNVYGVTFGGGDGYGIGGDGVIFELTPNAVPTSVNITKSSPNPSLPGRTVNVTFTVAQTVAGIDPPTGTVTVTANTGESCFEALPASGKGNCRLLFATAGTRTLTVAYSGDSGDLASVSSPFTQTTMSPTTTDITKNTPDPARVGETVTVEYTVTAKNGTNATKPTGSVSVNSSTGESCTGTVAKDGKGSCKLTFSSSGSRTLTATYGGDTDNESSISIAAVETVK